MNLTKNPLIHLLILSTTALAMEKTSNNETTPSLVIGHTYVDNLTPPLITLEQYANELVMGESINGWGDLKGNIHAWWQSKENQDHVSNTAGQLLNDLPFFKNTLHPTIDGNRLRCDYSLPIVDEDSSRGESTLSLFRNATPEEIQAAQSFPTEKPMQMISRHGAWIKKLEEMRVSNEVESLLIEDLIIGTVVNNINDFRLKNDFFQILSDDLMNKNSKYNFVYLHIDDIKLKHKLTEINTTLSSELAEDFLVLANPISNIGKSERSLPFYYHDTGSATLAASEIDFKKAIFNIHGSLKFSATLINLSQVRLSLVSHFSITSTDKECPIKKIRLFPANNSNTMVISAKLQLTKTPQITLECHNVTKLELKFRKNKTSNQGS